MNLRERSLETRQPDPLFTTNRAPDIRLAAVPKSMRPERLAEGEMLLRREAERRLDTDLRPAGSTFSCSSRPFGHLVERQVRQCRPATASSAPIALLFLGFERRKLEAFSVGHLGLDRVCGPRTRRRPSSPHRSHAMTALRRSCEACEAEIATRRRSSSATRVVDRGSSPRRRRPSSKTAGLSRIHLRSCMRAEGLSAKGASLWHRSGVGPTPRPRSPGRPSRPPHHAGRRRTP